jgi:thiol-disulfide isomerase/thioredoxin
MILWLALSLFLSGNAAPADTSLPESFDWSFPVKAWKADSGSFSRGQGHWSLVFFFSPSCGHCHKAWPVVEEWNRRYASRGLHVEAVASGYANAQDLGYFEQDMMGIFPFPVYHDTGKVLGERMRIRSVPTFFLVDPAGNYLRWFGSYPATLDAIEGTIAREFRTRRSRL